MKTCIQLFFSSTLLLISSCSESTNPIVPEPNSIPIYFNFTLRGSSYHVSNTDYTFEENGYTKTCGTDWVRGLKDFVLEDLKDDKFVTSVSFSLTKKVFKDELDPLNDMSYLNKVLNAGTLGFPINPSGYYEVYDQEKSLFTVNRGVGAEAFLEIKTKDNFYRSSSVVPNERSEKSFITIHKIIKNENEDKTQYAYFVEGTFKTNLFVGMYGTTSVEVEGSFYWPVHNIKDSELLSLCK